MKTLKELCLQLGVTRRAVQGYQEAGLVRATTKNKYGHLLYDEEAVGRIKCIKFLQDVGFSVKEISELIDAPKIVLRKKLESRIQQYESELAEGERRIQHAKKVIEALKQLETEAEKEYDESVRITYTKDID